MLLIWVFQENRGGRRMQNKEVYQQELLDLMVSGVSFGVNKFTGEPCECDEDSPDVCKICKFFLETEYSCEDSRREWLESEQCIPQHDFEFESNDDVYWLTCDGEVLWAQYDNGDWCQDVNAFGNMSKNKEYMEQRAKQIQLYNLLSNFAHEVNQGWEPDWSDENEAKWYVYIDHFHTSAEISNDDTNECLNTVYFRTKDLAEQAANEIVLPFIKKESENEK